MLRKIQKLSSLMTVIGIALFLSACGGGSGSGSAILSVSITPTATSVPINGQAQFQATVSNSTTTSAVTWEVNGVAGGSSTTGTIAASNANNQVGIYTAPAVVPTTNNGQVSITAVSQQSTATISNTAIVTVTSGQGLLVNPSSTNVSAGGTFTFSATLNGVADSNVTWAVSSANGGNIGSIGVNTGVYLAPSSPPPGAVVTITVTDTKGNGSGTATVQIIYSDASLKGPFSFSYTGDDGSGFLSVAGSFVTDGAGHIESGIEDADAFDGGGTVYSQIAITGGTYTVGPDGRTTAQVFTSLAPAPNGIFWQFALTSNQHAVMIRFDNSATGSGTIDQQNLNDFVASAINLPYVFDVSGADTGFNPLGVAGKFTANGNGLIPAINSILDFNDSGSVTSEDTTLGGSYLFDAANPGTGRGILTLTSSKITQIQFAFYVVDNTHLRLVEIDHNAFLAGDMYSAPVGNSFSLASLAKANYVFTAGGASSAGPFSPGGVFTSDGNGNITGGILDINNNGSSLQNQTVTSCAYTVDPGTGRLDIKISIGNGACTSGNANNYEFAVYQTAQNSAVMVELDTTRVSTGLAFLQQSTSSPVGSYALNVTGLGINKSGAFEQDTEGQITLASASVTAGNFDINNFGATFQTDPISTASSTIGAPATNGRGTAKFVVTNPSATYNLIYYVINSNTALLLDVDGSRVANGIIAKQF